MNNSKASTSEAQSIKRELTDLSTGEVFAVVYEDIEMHRLESRMVAIPRLVVQPTGDGCTTNTPKRTSLPRFVLAYSDIWEFFGDTKVSQYEKAVMKFLIKNMGYNNRVQVRASVIASSLDIGRPDASKAMKRIKGKGMIVESKKNALIPDIPVYRVNPRLIFAGQDSQLSRAIAIFDAEMARAHDPAPRLRLVKS